MLFKKTLAIPLWRTLLITAVLLLVAGSARAADIEAGEDSGGNPTIVVSGLLQLRDDLPPCRRGSR